MLKPPNCPTIVGIAVATTVDSIDPMKDPTINPKVTARRGVFKKGSRSSNSKG